jgi:hypothetical protein
MKIAIDSYCYHRYFGEAYVGLQPAADRAMTVWDFLRRAHRLGVAGVSLESCFLPCDGDFLRRLRDALDGYGFERVWAWATRTACARGRTARRPATWSCTWPTPGRSAPVSCASSGPTGGPGRRRSPGTSAGWVGC